ncbi:MAG TPA: PilZ domain-containing protein [Steroidobacteraceae bacterium]|nr:PilZ domain-containing protein [Steroidobacteraceae bacterium]
MAIRRRIHGPHLAARAPRSCSRELSRASGVPLIGLARTIIETAAMEHRWGNRREISHAVRVRTPAGLVATGTLRNISMSGALLATDAPLQLSGHLEVQMFARSEVVHPINAAAAHVVRRCAGGYGIEWAELSPPAVQLLTSILEGTRRQARQSLVDPGAQAPAQPAASVRRRKSRRR